MVLLVIYLFITVAAAAMASIFAAAGFVGMGFTMLVIAWLSTCLFWFSVNRIEG